MDKKILIGIIAIVIILVIIGIVITISKFSNKFITSKSSLSYKDNSTQIKNESKGENIEEDNIYSSGKHHVQIIVKNYGTIELELDADTVPITVSNFVKLTNEGFYNGLTFHRIIDGFMIQGGDPQGDGYGGSDKKIKGEFSANGVKNNISHIRGVISMARSNAYNSASSQFFIVHQDSTFLDGQYAGFGKVTSGIEIVDDICKDTKVEDNNGTVLKENQPIIEKIIVID